MGIREIFARISKRKKEEKEELAKMLREKRMEKISDDRMKSPNERELEKFIEEKRQKMIKERLTEYRNQHQKRLVVWGKQYSKAKKHVQRR